MGKILILYYSRKGENYVNGHIENLQKGNTERCAEYIQKALGGDLFEIQTIENYSLDYRKCTLEAKKELETNIKPELKQYLNTIADYETVFILGPCWWGTYPMAVFSLLEKLDFTNKKVKALMTHEGSGMGSSMQDLHKYCKGATFLESKEVRGSKVQLEKENIIAWAKKGL